MIDIQTTDHGILITVKVAPKSRANTIRGIHAGQLKIAVTAAPEQGKANAAVALVLCESLGLSARQVTLVSGATSTSKKYLLTELTAEELNARLAELL